MKKPIKAAVVLLAALVFVVGFTGCASGPTTRTLQYGQEGPNTIALNLTRDSSVGAVYVTHVNGSPTGAVYGKQTVYVNPLYVELTGNPIIFTILCPTVTGRDKKGNEIVEYRTTELRLFQVANLKPGDVLTLRWMYQTQTFAFIDASGNFVQQSIPTFN